MTFPYNPVNRKISTFNLDNFAKPQHYRKKAEKGHALESTDTDSTPKARVKRVQARPILEKQLISSASNHSSEESNTENEFTMPSTKNAGNNIEITLYKYTLE